MQMLKMGMAVLLVLGMAGCSQQKKAEMKAEAPATDQVAAVTMTEVTSMADLMAHPEQYEGKTVLVEGHVTGRCPESGCWISMDTGNPDSRFIVRTEDESFIFPAECVDKDVQVQGAMTRKSSTPAEDELKEEGEDHECPRPEYYFKPQAIKIKA